MTSDPRFGGGLNNPYNVRLPKPAPWADQPTLFKLPGPGAATQHTVLCQHCGEEFSIVDYLSGEINEEGPCPACNITAREHRANVKRERK